MINSIILVFIGGAVGAIIRELLMLGTPHLSDNFPLDILVANIAAAFLLGLVTALHTRRVISDDTNLLVGTGVMGGLSTFSSFVYGAVVLMGASTQSAVVATIYVGVSLVIGYGAVTLGMKCGKGRQS
ncbi:CrcB family protein [Chelatococcus asaccharovorans]|uniref:CrcB family protein n=1 Tax=Chelatococcus asaccharovorans TaxID=28210 RepID=UPI00224C6D00|nr:CrcB family protein [Chelatococcus asaccharovorans]CAH1669759.1 putative fluoride ion transporter CrcB [Chelatococcus asaccharovorans]CAH1678819.1 putative fluoride ion transporter CrcB [Chelatococcus asaccharovorans]